jgi:hypothetical protein
MPLRWGLMDLLAQPFDTITFQDVVDFCDQKIVENTELDYKQVIPKDLAKHVAAMSNQYGGLIIVGVEEDPATGEPATAEGIVKDGKQVDRVHQFANNVRPLPTYDVRTTDEANGKVFLLIRINGGGAPPYTLKNDPTVYLRTGNITTPLGRADAEVVRELYAKRANAESARQANVSRAKAVLLSVLEQGDLERPKQVLHEEEEDGSKRFLLTGLGDNFRMLTAWLQPYYPGRELAEPRDIHASLGELRIMNRVNRGQSFPAEFDVEPMARGMRAVSLKGTGDLSFSADQVYANGFFCHSEHYGFGVRGGEAEKVHLTDIARVLYTTLLFGRKFYQRFAYSGLAQGAVQLTGAKGRAVKLILYGRWSQDGYPRAIDAAYRWPIKANTHQLGDDDWLKGYFYKFMREIYWDLGFTDVDEQTFTAFLDQWQFR